MILRSLELENFGRFRGQSFELRRGMNLVVGQNEAGKSTLAEVIPAVLFGLRQADRYKPWGRNACSAKLVFEGRKRTVEIQRNLLSDEVHLVERDDLYHTLSEFKGRVPVRGRSAIYKEYYDLLEKLLGIGDEALFRATCFFGHRPQEWTGEELSQKLRMLMGSNSAESDYAEIMDSLIEEHFSLTRANPWGRDKQRDRELEEMTQQLLELEQAQKASPDKKVVANSGHDDRIRILTDELAQAHDEYARGVSYVEKIRSKISAAQKSSEDTPLTAPVPATASVAFKGEGGAQELERLKAQLKDAGLPATPPENLHPILSEAADIRQDLARFQQPLSMVNQREKKIPMVPWAVLSGISVCLLLCCAVAWWQDLQPLTVSAVCAAGVALVCGWGGWRQLQKQKSLAACQQERQRLEQKKAVVQERQTELSERCEALGLPSSAIDLVRLHKLLDKQRDTLARQTKQNAGSADGIVEPPAIDSETSSSLSEQASKDPELLELERRLTEFAESLGKKEAELQILKQKAGRSGVPLIDFDSEAQAQDDLRTRKMAIEERVAVLRTSIEILAESVEEFARSDLHRLVQEVSRLYKKLTKGRYSQVRLNADMSPEIKVDERRWQPIDRFSRGTVDALYLSLRVAMAKVRGDGRSLPLVLDDPFAHLDQKRQTAALNMINLAAADGQLILLSHNLDLTRRAAKERWYAISLGDEQVEAETDEGDDHAGQLHLL